MEERATIGILGIADFRSNIGQDLIRGVLDGASDANLDVVNCCASTKYSVADDLNLARYCRTYFRFMNRRNVSGIISWASSFSAVMPHEEVLAANRALLQLPVVALGIPILDEVPCIYTEPDYDIALIMDHLIRTRKYRRIGFFGTASRRPYMLRFEAYKRSLASHGIPVDESLVFLTEGYEHNDAVKVVEKIVAGRTRTPPLGIDALVCVSDIVAGYVITEFLARGVRVPEDIAVTGFNNQIESLTSPVPITTLDLCFYERGYRAVALLQEAIAARKTGSKVDSIVYPSRLVVRQSCGQFETLITEARYQSEAVAERIEEEGTADVGLMGILRKSLADLGILRKGADIDALARAVVSDYRGTTENALLTYIRAKVQSPDRTLKAITQEWNCILTTIRRVVLSFADRAGEKRRELNMENILHQARIMVSLFDSYYIVSLRHDAYKYTMVGRIAIEFATAMDVTGILAKLEGPLTQLDIPSVCLVLQEEMGPDLGECKVVYAYPGGAGKQDAENSDTLPLYVLPRDIPYARCRRTQVMRLLYYQDYYLGYALFGMGPKNMAVYDTLQSLLTHALYAVYLRKGCFRNVDETQILLRTKRVRGILEHSASNETQTGTLTAERLLEYLASHLGSPTDLNGFSRDLGISRSNLMRRAKRLTGYSIQVLHEMLKIERAVILLERSPGTNIGEIASRLGFHNQSYFAKVFKKHKGLSPLAWRKHR